MRDFIKKIITFFLVLMLVIAFYCFIATIASSKYNGINTIQQIEYSFKNAIAYNYNCYFLGNSRIYRGINPEKFKSVNAYNFAHDNDSYNQMYYKLLYLLQNNKHFEYLIIGTDYFQFSFLSDTRNYMYSFLFPEGYQNDYEKKSKLELLYEFCLAIWNNKRNSGKYIRQWICHVPEPQNLNYQKENGQYIVYGINSKPGERIHRDYAIKDVQLYYFKKILDICKKNKIELYVIMPPLREGELVLHDNKEREIFDEMIYSELNKKGFRDRYINFMKLKGVSPFTDFMDVTHLNVRAADEYSDYMHRIIFKK